jgi:WNK lysine deficient protein kinase
VLLQVAEGEAGIVRTIDFIFDPEVDTAENLADEISTEFALSATDTEICAAALREWLAKEMPGSDSSK